MIQRLIADGVAVFVEPSEAAAAAEHLCHQTAWRRGAFGIQDGVFC
jgi:hypothetical protein